ncbi:glutamate cyclase domain-containing protein [Desulfoluna spongiiphila]|uniref:D-glutamate cyclase-like C-terminal domain-containing protein n=1 Tax=Desulfoluna spongiiphila TaxID=419481 RepID=A0A1G5H4T0_9BACT|nr:glutamate cyclase domain-containing protein [Desulfoluna spongiiphila]SCY58796.1 protein of unknown function [Desulfoluna spongiiphila]
MTPLDDLSTRMEEELLKGGARGIEQAAQALDPGYLLRTAQGILDSPGPVLITTGFPVSGTFETDGPVGAIALYRVLEYLNGCPVFVGAPPLSTLLGKRFQVTELPIATPEETAPHIAKLMDTHRPGAVVSVERPGASAQGSYHNMRGSDITPHAAKVDALFNREDLFSVAFGDGGNEIGMGNVLASLSTLPIIPSVTPCHELVVSSVSNWGVYGVIAMMEALTGEELLDLCDPAPTTHWLVENGCVDGVTVRPEPTEDGFPLSRGETLIKRFQSWVSPFSTESYPKTA